MMKSKDTFTKGMDDVDYALERYKKGEITIGKAAEITKKDLREMMTLAAKKDIPFQYSLKELGEDFKSVKQEKIIKKK